MMRVYFYLTVFLLQFQFFQCVPPYFPTQIVFRTDDGFIIAIDEVNQRASRSSNYTSTEQAAAYVMKHFPYATPDTPESKFYVQLVVDSSTSPNSSDCQYAAYWKYGTEYFNQFPVHWWLNASSFEIKNYMRFSSEMIQSNQSSSHLDYWYAKEQCRLESGEILPCQEIYFLKSTPVPSYSTEVVRTGMRVVQQVTHYEVLAIGEPGKEYFDSIPKNWSTSCRDYNLGVNYDPLSVVIALNKSSRTRVSLTSPPHVINGDSTVRIQWKLNGNEHSFKWSPDHFYFNEANFDKAQILTITRMKDDVIGTLVPVFNGGGFDKVPSDAYPLILA